MVKKTPQTDSRHIARPKGPQRAGPSKDNISNYWRIFENNVPTTIVWIQITGPHKELLALGRGLVEKDFLGEISYSIGILEMPDVGILELWKYQSFMGEDEFNKFILDLFKSVKEIRGKVECIRYKQFFGDRVVELEVAGKEVR